MAGPSSWTAETLVFTLKANPLREADLAEFVEGYSPDDRSKRALAQFSELAASLPSPQPSTQLAALSDDPG